MMDVEIVGETLNEKMKTVYKVDQSFGNITKLMVFRVERMERKM